MDETKKILKNLVSQGYNLDGHGEVAFGVVDPRSMNTIWVYIEDEHILIDGDIWEGESGKAIVFQSSKTSVDFILIHKNGITPVTNLGIRLFRYQFPNKTNSQIFKDI